MDIKEFRYPDKDPKYADDRNMDDVYSVLTHRDQLRSSESNRYVINAHEGVFSLSIYPDEVDAYMDILNYIKQRENTKND